MLSNLVKSCLGLMFGTLILRTLIGTHSQSTQKSKNLALIQLLTDCGLNAAQIKRVLLIEDAIDAIVDQCGYKDRLFQEYREVRGYVIMKLGFRVTNIEHPVTAIIYTASANDIALHISDGREPNPAIESYTQSLVNFRFTAAERVASIVRYYEGLENLP